MANEKLDSQLAKLRIDKAQKRARRRRIPWMGIVVALFVATVAYALYNQANAPIPVTTARVEQETVTPGKGPALVTASGYVIPRHKVEVTSKIVGRVEEVMVTRGDHVDEGDVIIKIEDDDYQARLLAAQAQVAALKARLAELQTGSRPQEIAAAKAAVEAAEATLLEANVNFERVEALVEAGAVSKQELDRARTARDVAQAQLNAERKSAELVNIGPRKEQIQAAEADLRQAQANVALANTELAFTVVRAPITGVILEKLAEKGELVTNMNFGGTRGAKNSVVSMANLDDLQVEVDVNESDMSKVWMEQAVEIRLDSAPQRVYQGKVDEISPQADRQKGTVQVKVAIADPDEYIRIEVTARVTFLGKATETSAPESQEERVRLWIPEAAIVHDGEPTVFVLKDGEAVSTPVTLGTEAERGVEVMSGLTGDETLITSPVEQLTDGARVAPAA